MAKDIKEILKNGSKAKLIQLAIDSPEFNRDGIPNPTLTKDEIQIIKERARQEGWDGELFRATYKADDIEALTLYTLSQIYIAVSLLQGFVRILEKTDIFLNALNNKYLKDYNEKTERYDTVVKKTREEYTKDIEEVNWVINPTAPSLSEEIMRLQGKFYKWKRESKETNKNDDVRGVFELYKYRLKSAKTSFYTISRSKFAGYRLYSKDGIQEIENAFHFQNDFLVLDADNCLDHIDYLLDNFEKYLPELVEAIKEQERFYIPDKKERGEIFEYLRNGATFERGKYDTKNDKKEDAILDAILEEDYLLSDLKPKEREEIKQKVDNLENYVRYGK